MTVKQLADKFNLSYFNLGVGEDRQVRGGHVGDLLSHVMANCQEGNAWITILTNLNTIAVATLTEASCIIIPQGIIPDRAVLERASREGVPVLGSELNGFDLCGLLMEAVSK